MAIQHTFILVMVLLSQIPTLTQQSILCNKEKDCTCIKDEPCVLNCIGDEYCKGSDIQLTCKSSQPCTINCIGYATCKDATITSNGATDVTLTCTGGDHVCMYTTFNCGTDQCSLECDTKSDDSCKDMHINVNQATSFACTGNCFSYSSSADGTANLITYVPTSPITSINVTVVENINVNVTSSISTAFIVMILLMAICCFITICWFIRKDLKQQAQTKNKIMKMYKNQDLSFPSAENKNDKTLRHMDEDIVSEINQSINNTPGVVHVTHNDMDIVEVINQSINNTSGVVKHDDMDIVEIINVTPMLMEYNDEGKTNSQHHFTIQR